MTIARLFFFARSFERGIQDIILVFVFYLYLFMFGLSLSCTYLKGAWKSKVLDIPSENKLNLCHYFLKTSTLFNWILLLLFI